MSDKIIAMRPEQMPGNNVVQFHGYPVLGHSLSRPPQKQSSKVIGRIEDRDRVFSAAKIIKDSFMQAAVMTGEHTQ